MRLWTVFADPGSVSVVSRPLGDELILIELDEVRAAGVDILISLLEVDELRISGLTDEGLAAPVAGLQFFHVPTPDQTSPPSDEDTLRLLANLGREVINGRHVAAHCHAGHGRSPAFAAAVLVMAGYGADEAMNSMALARGKDVPHRTPQRDWVRWVEQQRLLDHR